MKPETRIGITTTVPIEVIYAAGLLPLDLNNVFISSRDPAALVQDAERAGYPITSCAWVKGIYSVVRRKEIARVIGVTEGDCADTKALLDVLRTEGVEVIPFAYPQSRQPDALRREIVALAQTLGAHMPDVHRAKERLDSLRAKVHHIDRLAWQEGKVSGFEGHYYQVCCSDMNSDPEAFAAEVDAFLAQANARAPSADFLRLGFVGVPPILTDLYDFLEQNGARVVYHEVQRQFSMPNDAADVVEQYLAYTYPYDVALRLRDIQEQVAARRLDALIHYVQAFCFRAIHDIILRKQMNLPVLTLEGDYPGRLEGHHKVRIEAFLDMLVARKGHSNTTAWNRR